MIDPRKATPEYRECIRLMTLAITSWKGDAPRFGLPSPRTMPVMAIASVWPVVAQNAAARDLVQQFEHIGQAVGGAGKGPSLFMLTVALASSGLPASCVEFRPLAEFERAKRLHDGG